MSSTRRLSSSRPSGILVGQRSEASIRANLRQHGARGSVVENVVLDCRKGTTILYSTPSAIHVTDETSDASPRRPLARARSRARLERLRLPGRGLLRGRRGHRSLLRIWRQRHERYLTCHAHGHGAHPFTWGSGPRPTLKPPASYPKAIQSPLHPACRQPVHRRVLQGPLRLGAPRAHPRPHRVCRGRRGALPVHGWRAPRRVPRLRAGLIRVTVTR